MNTINFSTKAFIALFLFSIIISCDSQSKSQQNGKQEQENFYTFFESFKADSLFQKERIMFPLTCETVDSLIVIEKNDWTYATYYWDSTYAKRQLDAYYQIITVDSNQAVISCEGVENCINFKDIFIRKNGKWYLQKEIDGSL